MSTKFKAFLIFLVLSLTWCDAFAGTQYINSVTPETVTIGSGSTTASITVPAASGTYFLLWAGNSTTATTSHAQGNCYATLSGTTLTATRTTSSTNTCTVNVSLVDATSNLVTSVQRGTIAITTGLSKTATITSVTTTVSSVNLLGWSQGNATFTFAPNRPILSLTNSTTVTATVSGLTTSMTASYQVINWNISALNSNTQYYNVAWNPATITSTTQAISSVTVANSILLYDGDYQNCCTQAVFTQWGQITAPTVLTVSNNYAQSTTINYAAYIVEFVPGVLTQADQKGTLGIGSSTTGTASITSAPTATTAVYITGYGTANTATTTIAPFMPVLRQSATSQLTGTMGDSGSVTIGYEASTFSTGVIPAAQCVAAGNHQIGIIYPAYIAPPDPAFSGLITLMGTYPNVPVNIVLNPASGPGTGVIAAYTTVIAQLQAAGATVLGYVPTGYGVANTDYNPQNQATIEAQVNDWITWYPTVNGIFFDEMDNTASATTCTSIAGGNCLSLYQQLTTYTHSLGMPLTYGNPGQNTIATYLNSSPPATDRIMVYETNAYGSAAQLNNGGLCGTNGYNCAAAEYAVSYSAAALLLMEQNDSWIFMTDGPSANPYDVAPTYLSTVMAALSAYNTGGGVSCPMIQGFR